MHLKLTLDEVKEIMLAPEDEPVRDLYKRLGQDYTNVYNYRSLRTLRAKEVAKSLGLTAAPGKEFRKNV